MQLNHIDLQVSDVQRAAAFFTRHFGFTLTSNPHSPAIAILNGEDGFTLVLQKRKTDAPYPDGFHIGFLLSEVEQVHAVREAVCADGYAFSPVSTNGRGTGTYGHFEDVLIEVSVRRHR